MTLAETIYQRTLKLPEPAAREALDFVEFLEKRYGIDDSAPRNEDAGDANAYDQWFKAQVQKALDDPRPGVSSEDARAYFAKRREALRQKAQTKE